MKTLKIKITCIKTDHTGHEDIKEYFANVKAGEQLNIDYEKLAGYKVVTLEMVEEENIFLCTIVTHTKQKEIYIKNSDCIKKEIDTEDKNLFLSCYVNGVKIAYEPFQTNIKDYFKMLDILIYNSIYNKSHP